MGEMKNQSSRLRLDAFPCGTSSSGTPGGVISFLMPNATALSELMPLGIDTSVSSERYGSGTTAHPDSRLNDL
jgi:hypothetical protein